MSQRNKNLQPPNPERFENYTLLEDKKGFKLPDGNIFIFDKNGGWTDEYGNHYNSNGEPIDSDIGYEEFDNFGYDEYEEDFFAYENDDGMQDFDAKEDDYKIIELLANLDSFPEEKEIIIEFTNLEFKAYEKDVAHFFMGEKPFDLMQNKVYVNKKLLFTVEIDRYFDDQKNRSLKNGKGRIITDDRNFAKLCAELHGSKLLNRPLYLSIPSYRKDSDLDDFETKFLTNQLISGKKESVLPQKTVENQDAGKKMNPSSTAFNLSVSQKQETEKPLSEKTEKIPLESQNKKEEQDKQKQKIENQTKTTKLEVESQKNEKAAEEKKIAVKEPEKKVPVEEEYDPSDPWSKPIKKILPKPDSAEATQSKTKKPVSKNTESLGSNGNPKKK